MKKHNEKHALRWPTLFFLFLIATLLISGYLSLENEERPPTEQPQKENISVFDGALTNSDFSNLIENNLADLGFVDTIQFQGKSDGRFSVSGTLSDPKRLTSVCTELKGFESVLSVLEGERITVHGHLGKDEKGNGCFVTDTITASGFTVPAGAATEYIEEYTTLNTLLEVPYEQITLNNDGISFAKELPRVIQTVLYK